MADGTGVLEDKYRGLKDSIAGTFAGMAQVCAGHPFDTIKVRLQTQPSAELGQTPKFNGAMDCVRKTIAEEGMRGLYKGMGVPLATVGLFNAVLFGTFGQAKAMFGDITGDTLSLFQIGLAGSVGGFAVGFVATPTELVKSKLQVQYAPKQGEVASYKGPIDCARQIFKQEGIAGLYRGGVPTFAREIVANNIYFMVYEGIKRSITGSSSGHMSPFNSLMAGGMAGVFVWVTVYPVDMIKSRIQIDRTGTYTSMLPSMRKVIAEEGVRALYKGFTPCLARAFPANAVTFATYEAIMRMLNTAL